MLVILIIENPTVPEKSRRANKSAVPLLQCVSKFNLVSHFSFSFSSKSLQHDDLNMLLLDRNLFCYFIFKRGLNSEISHMCKVYRRFIFHSILMHFFFEYIAPRASDCMSTDFSVYYNIRDKLN
jgi:hypothetical protein